MANKYDQIVKLLTSELPELYNENTLTRDDFTQYIEGIYIGEEQLLRSPVHNVSFNFTPRISGPNGSQSHGIVFYTSNRYGRVEPITQTRLDTINNKLENIGDPTE